MSTVAPPRPPVRRPEAPPPPPTGADWRTKLPWRSAEAKAAPGDDLATLCLGLVSLAVALSMGRLFRGTGWLPYAVAAAIVGHALAWGLRRLGAGLILASLASALLSLLAAAELVTPQATTYGLPTPYTFQVMGQALTEAQASFRTAIPPVAPSSGFLAAVVVGLCMCAFLADWAAFRMRTAFEACVPALGLFVFASVLRTKSHPPAAVVGFAAAALLFLIVQRANLDSGRTAWFGGTDRGALPSLLRTGTVLGSVAVIGAVLVVAIPLLSFIVPGDNSDPLVPLKKGAGDSGSGLRTTVTNPLVDIRARLRKYANIGVFTVKAERPAYWRLTSLDDFNGTIWSSNERYAKSRGQLTPSSGLAGTKLVQDFTVSGLSSIWLPAAYRPAGVEGIGALSYSPGSASLITPKDTTDGVTYRLTSVVPTDSPQALRQAPTSAPGRSELGADYRRYTKVGGQVSPRVQQKARDLAAGQDSPYAKALAIQNYLRSGRFRYSLEVPTDDSGSAIDRFLFQTQAGFCQQFAGSYAMLARLMGLPTRVAVGFKPGTDQGGTFAVKDKDAHAWPEVYLEGVGWTAFEPTPGSGNPQAVAYTGVPYVPAAPAGPGTGASGVPTTVTTAAAPTTTPDETTSTTAAPVPPDPGPASSSGPWRSIRAALRRLVPLWLTLAGVGGLIAGLAAFVTWERRDRRRRAGLSPEARVHMAWEESLGALALVGMRPRRGETVAELLHRLTTPAEGAAVAGVEQGTPGSDALLHLGAAVEQTAYTGRNASGALADAAEANRAVITAACRASLRRWPRLLSAIDPRPALARLRDDRAAKRRPRPTTT